MLNWFPSYQAIGICSFERSKQECPFVKQYVYRYYDHKSRASGHSFNFLDYQMQEQRIRKEVWWWLWIVETRASQQRQCSRCWKRSDACISATLSSDVTLSSNGLQPSYGLSRCSLWPSSHDGTTCCKWHCPSRYRLQRPDCIRWLVSH